MPTTAASRTAAAKAKRNATTAKAKANGTHEVIMDDVVFSGAGCDFVVSVTMADGRKRTNGAAVTAHPRGADKSGVKGWTTAILAAYTPLAKQIGKAIDEMDKAAHVGQYRPVTETAQATAASADEVKAGVLAALAAKLDMSPDEVAALIS